MVALWIFWVSAALVVYVYLGFPAALALITAVYRRPVAKARHTPTVSLVVPAYNEESVIAEKLECCLALDYPADKLEIVIASDGSKDRTVERARPFESDPRVRILAFEQNRGKLAMLNDVLGRLDSEIVVFSDASTMPEQDALRVLVSNFADPRVGAVSGIYKIRDSGGAKLGKQEDLYWKYETFLKEREAALGSILGAHGALYGIRRALYPFPDKKVINDDFVIPMRIVARGYRAAYEPGALAWEEAEDSSGFGRRVRLMVGNWAQLAEMRGLLWPPSRWLTLFFFLSHKAARLFAPFAMLAALVANFFLLGSPFFQVVLALQLGFYALAAAGAMGWLRPRALRLPYYFTMINLAAFFGFYYAVVRRGRVGWK
ncbi:MAG: glycosyltransferase family 2 protein [Acidobacteria bacterium]|nr:glycosyltransferase family 2 protein [Acidobacteriota bacterium]